MYEEYFRLSGLPFQLSPDPTYYYSSEGHRRALSYLKYGVYQGEGFVVVTGEIGAGKTTLVRALIGELDPNKIVAAQLVSTQLGAADVLRSVLATFGLPVKGSGKAEMLHTIEAFLTSLFIEGKRAILIVDEAQNLPPDAIEELRMLSNFQIQDRGLLQSLLVGQPELREMLRSTRHEQLRQRIIASYHLGAMSAEDTKGYITHRLGCVGWNKDPEFDAEAFDAIFRFSGGVPRKINRLCNRLLLSTYLAGGHLISAQDVIEVAKEIGEEIGADLVTVRSAKKARAATPDSGEEQVVKARKSSAQPAADVGAAPPASSQKVVDLHVHDQPPAASKAAVREWDVRPGSVVCIGDTVQAVAMLGQLCRSLSRSRSTPAPSLAWLRQAVDVSQDEVPWLDMGLLKPNAVVEIPATASDKSPVASQSSLMEQFFDAVRPAAVVLAGDSDALLIAALCASKLSIPLIRIDAGLRSFDRTTPDEMNRIVVDNLAAVLFASEFSAVENMERESLPSSRIELAGNLLIDAIVIALPKAMSPTDLMNSSGVPLSLVTGRAGYCVIDVQWRDEDPSGSAELMGILLEASEILPMIWLVDQRTEAQLAANAVFGEKNHTHVAAIPKAGYFESIGLISEAALVVTDSASQQVESTALGVPCLTVGSMTSHPVTVELGTNTLVKLDRLALTQSIQAVAEGRVKSGRIPEHWDGKTASRIAHSLGLWFKANRMATAKAQA
ncbi:MAG: XrtA/PEP-CTERM system-associated ATPase [Burkholderiaceae bacterium]